MACEYFLGNNDTREAKCKYSLGRNDLGGRAPKRGWVATGTFGELHRGVSFGNMCKTPPRGSVLHTRLPPRLGLYIIYVYVSLVSSLL